MNGGYDARDKLTFTSNSVSRLPRFEGEWDDDGTANDVGDEWGSLLAALSGESGGVASVAGGRERG
jgi:hypothetical protein